MGKKKNSGFTLIEIVIAVTILSLSLITLIGLEGAATSEALRTRNKQFAMLMARRIMTNIELDAEVLTDQTLTDSAEGVLNQFGTDDPADRATERSSDVPMSAELSIKGWNIPGLPDDSVKKVTLRVFWSSNPVDSIEVVYFVPAPTKES